MNDFFTTYLIVWASLCGIAVVLAAKIWPDLEIANRPYWRNLFVPWKLTTFAISGTAMVVIAPWTGDPTWDWFDAGFMALFAYLGAPWAVGVIYQGLRGWQNPTKIYIAACVWMFSASWSYDLYILLRDGEYPSTWAANIAASSILYACAGLMWSLERRPGRGIIFSFMEKGWPTSGTPGTFKDILWFAVPFMAIVGAMIGAFLVDYLGLLR